MRGAAVSRALLGQKIWPHDVDACARNVLVLLKQALGSGIPFDAPEESLDTPEVRATLRTAAAAATVLLKNQRGILPIQPTSLQGKTVALLGPNARVAQFSGGGSARLLPTYLVSPFVGIKAAVEEAGATLRFAEGATTHKYVPHAHEYLTLPDGSDTRAALMEFWNAPPSEDYLSIKANVETTLHPPVWTCETAISEAILMDGIDDKVNRVCWIRYSAIFTPDADGTWEFGLNVGGRGNLLIDGKCAIDLSTQSLSGGGFSGLKEDKKVEVKGMEKDRHYSIEVRISNKEFIVDGPGSFSRGGLRLGAAPYIEIEQGIAEATKVAKEADVAILVVGLNQEWVAFRSACPSFLMTSTVSRRRGLIGLTWTFRATPTDLWPLSSRRNPIRSS
jgi:beta-glucosidase